MRPASDIVGRTNASSRRNRRTPSNGTLRQQYHGDVCSREWYRMAITHTPNSLAVNQAGDEKRGSPRPDMGVSPVVPTERRHMAWDCTSLHTRAQHTHRVREGHRGEVAERYS
jgi:hypothetical protein